MNLGDENHYVDWARLSLKKLKSSLDTEKETLQVETNVPQPATSSKGESQYLKPRALEELTGNKRKRPSARASTMAAEKPKAGFFPAIDLEIEIQVCFYGH